MSELTLLIIFLPPLVFVILYVMLNYFVSGDGSVCVVVLGDYGRSPRMQYHSLSLAKEGFAVDVVAYGGSRPHREVEETELIQQHLMREVPSILKYFPKLLQYLLKVFWQTIFMATHLLLLPKFKYVLIQNPPSIPTIAVVWGVCLLRGSKLIIDWHNYGFTILGLALGENHLLVRFSKWFESWFGRRSDFNLCVTQAMKEDLQAAWGIHASVLYDRPPLMFKETDLETRHELFRRLSEDYKVFQSSCSDEDSTQFTRKTSNLGIEELKSRPALLISSTSWTEDEDFSVLFDALEDYNRAAEKTNSDLPTLACVITGKGPQKEYYSKLLSERNWSHVTVCLPWLKAEDYPLLLGSADIGVCLHKSSSGLDLPMKVVDMFGCNLPVCAVNFKCISELVRHNFNGMVFEDFKELTKQLQSLLKGFPEKTKELITFRENLRNSQENRWHDNWRKTVLPLLRHTERSLKPKQS